MIKEIFLDVETTGLDEKQHAIHQLSFGVYIDGQLKEMVDIQMRPFDGALIEQSALDLKQLTYDQIMAYPPMMDGYIKLIGTMGKYVNKFDKSDKFFFYAYNANFDNKFIRVLFDRCGDKFYGSWFWVPHIDIMSLAAEKLKHVRHEMPNFQLMTVAKQLGIEIDPSKAHDSLYDIEISKLVYNKSIEK